MHVLGLIAYVSGFLSTALMLGIACMGLNMQWGKTGLFNVGVAGFMGIGAYTSALLTTPASAGAISSLGLPIVVGCFGAMLVAGLGSLLVGALTLRLRTDYLAITTFGAAVMIQLVLLNATRYTGGALLGSIVVWGIWSLTGIVTGSVFAAEDQARAAALRIVMIGVLLCVVLVRRPRGLLSER